ncbi:acyl-CoA dehydrogenase, N-terminal domain protein [Mycolicibacterium hassiacum DSM 44199]|jgi:alkylation response protein AidB-like acyl-CoA dehydrogenase|uniref:Acyl-CoA dehydrogenase, N-terminal domain protein n=1 Tax=Mycolicibacterium hassiacum (strain DSM 44199 / CIP 105218 / JCM 12690 / 3849) TaxID=1122247 RepID=K5BI11_MYCHD|nr:acyl-CoA dehydrogenase [Mycolicibacterium hassiacum]EKF25511.1 acyl-CoA dehydrogenase, N-terminal domain protein [Mycolicibacterium hassiacum DSM 44199]MBX5487810.1 acyl-CoA dehydrogenase [Mycolicibacterium hassiacum]MDA4086634.1 acyl-CoA dehydrogenase [Mycolicibacterium hassiacum DSM 44199]VCT92883.1 Acyl-CoA dehydrogenase FadE34 [Mycolicibacterium hassiacum DSM 44199]
MPIAITTEHNDLADSVRSLVARVAPSEVLHEALETPIPNPPPYWKAAAEQGLQGLHLAESVGGQGFGILELAIVIAEFGYGAVPGPFVPSVIASALIAAHDPADPRLAGLASGETIAAYAIESGLTATRTGDKLVIRGEVRAVPAAAQASLLVLPVAIDSGEEWVVLDADQVEIEPVQSVDPLRPVAHVRVNAVEVGEDRVLSDLSRAHARALVSTLLSAECIGVARWATDTASEYAKIREQFGRPIGKFQAVKHKCAEMIADTERATAAVWDAAQALDELADKSAEETGFEFAAAVAATLAIDAVLHCTQDCIQVHGGIGFTWEHDTNVYYRRALGLAAAFGRRGEYPQRVVDLATSTGMRRLGIKLDPDTEKLRAEIRAEIDAIKAIPDDKERVVALAEGGWVVPHLPRPWGRGASPVEQIIIAQEFQDAKVERPNMGIASWLIPSVVAYGTEEQKQRFLPPTLRGEMIWCQLFSEPGAGSDLASLTTKATKVEGGWRITGQKIWTTGAQYSHWGMLLARTDPDAPKHKGITYFLLDMSSEGVEVKPLRELTGNAMFNTVFLDDVFVPDELVLGEVNRGWEVSRTTLTAERVSIGSSEPPFLPNLNRFVEFIRDGHFDQVAKHQAGHLIAEGHAAKVLNMRSTLLTLAGGDPMPAAAIGKLLSMRTGQKYAEFVVASFGTEGAVGDPNELTGRWAEFLLASRATTIYGGTSEVQLNIIAERLLGLPRDL